MNSNSVTPVENVVVAAVKAPKKPTLSAKYSRFLSFGHWFLMQTDLNEETRKQLFQQMTMFGSVEEQTTYFEGFFGALKETNKAMRKMVAEAKKPPKAPKAPRAKKVKAAPAADDVAAQLIADANGTEPVAPAETVAATVVAAKEKKPRAKKVKETVAADPVAEQIVATVEAAAPKEKKPRAKKVKETAEPVVATAEPVVATASADAQPVAAETKEKKPRAKKTDAAEKPKKTKKTEAVAPVAAPAPAVEDEGEDIQTRVVTIADKEYLIDGENNLYDINDPHDQVGTFNPENGQVLAL